MSKIPYSPDTHFLIDHANLSAPLLANKVTDSFGPVSGSLTTKFRTTSVLRMSAEATVHAICDGHLLIQPQTGDTTKVNLILKPSVSFAPLKVKYFIYRGVKKQDLLNHMTSKIEKIDLALTTQPDLLVKIWTQSINYNSPDHLDLGGSIETPPDEIPAILLGYDPAEPGTTLLDTYFFNDESVNADFQIPKCDKGEWIANVTGKIGLDIVLDTGDYHLDNEEELFKLDMEFARKAENVFDTATITTVNKRKKYKEYIHQFIDAAAFWGSHIDCGSIKLANDVAPKSSASDIFTSVVSKFQTKHKTYLYVKSERGRSYDFYSQYSTPGTGKLNFAPKGTATLVDYNQDGWPIVIKEFTQATASAKNELQFSLDFNIDSQLHEIDQRIVLNAVIPDWNDDNFILDSKLRVPKTKLNTQFNAIDNIPLKNTTVAADEKSIASFMMFSFLGDKKLTTLNYFDDLWKANVKPVFTIASNDNLCEWATINDNQLVDLSPETEINNTRIGLKVVFDNGKNSSNARKKRRLYVASILEVNQEELKKKERRDITVNGLKSGFEKTLTKNNYYSTVYDRTNYDVYKGSIDDSGTTIDTLSLVSNTDYELEDSYLQFGIMEEEYNKLIYDSASVPVSPPASPHLSVDATNIRFHLEDVNISVTKDYKKYKVGLIFEDDNGVLQSPLFPATAANLVYVYSIDDKYYFSKEFAEYQEFYQEFADATIEFRTKIVHATKAPGITTPYDGEFGFDWLRIADNNETAYSTLLNKGFERYSVGDTSNTHFETDEDFRALKKEYKSIQTGTLNHFYYVPWLNIFPTTFAPIPAPPATAPIPSEVELRVVVHIKSDHHKFEFDYDSNFFIIDKPVLSDTTIKPPKTQSNDVTIKITCIKDFGENKQIRVLAYPTKTTTKKQAKLAGKIMIQKNSSAFRKEQKIVLVKLDTNIQGTPNTGLFGTTEQDYIRKCMYQSLIYPIIEHAPDNLDLSGDTAYKKSGSTYGTYIYNNVSGSIKFFDTGINDLTEAMFIDVRTKFINDPVHTGNLKYVDYFTVFSFKEKSCYVGTPGINQKHGTKNTVLFETPAIRNDTTLAHEGFHGLGLYHTHKDPPPITAPEIKYLFNKRTTGNIESYLSLGRVRNYTWKWQWDIARKNV